MSDERISDRDRDAAIAIYNRLAPSPAVVDPAPASPVAAPPLVLDERWIRDARRSLALTASAIEMLCDSHEALRATVSTLTAPMDATAVDKLLSAFQRECETYATTPAWKPGDGPDHRLERGRLRNEIRAKLLSVASLTAECERLRSENGAVREDKARLDWMQANVDALSTPDYPRAWDVSPQGDVVHYTPLEDHPSHRRTVREAIDAARATPMSEEQTPT